MQPHFAAISGFETRCCSYGVMPVLNIRRCKTPMYSFVVGFIENTGDVYIAATPAANRNECIRKRKRSWCAQMRPGMIPWGAFSILALLPKYLI